MEVTNYSKIIVTRETEEGKIKAEEELFHNPYGVSSEKLQDWLRTWEKKNDREFDHALNEMGRKVRSLERSIALHAGENPSDPNLVDLAKAQLEVMPEGEAKHKLGKLIASWDKWKTCLELGLHLQRAPDADY